MIKVWLNITRPFNVIITGCAVFIGALLTGNITPLEKIILAILSAGFICAGGNVLNDFFDVEIDRINKPTRAIPAGRITKKAALLFSLSLTTIGIIIAIFITDKALLLAISAVVLLIVYNGHLKRNGGIIGNIIVSFTAALSLIYGGLAVGKLEGTLFPAIFAFLIHLGREIVKDIEDISGDRKAKSCSIPMQFGLSKSYYICFIPLFLLFILTPIPYLLHIYNILYLIMVILSVDSLIIFSFFFFRKKLDKSHLHKLSNILKLVMIFGIISLVIGIL